VSIKPWLIDIETVDQSDRIRILGLIYQLTQVRPHFRSASCNFCLDVGSSFRRHSCAISEKRIIPTHPTGALPFQDNPNRSSVRP
jgi:hypothetical protein